MNNDCGSHHHRTTIALEGLLDVLDLSQQNMGGSVEILGHDPVISSRHQLGTAVALALAAQGVAISTIQKLRSGLGDDVCVDARKAWQGLHCVDYFKQNGYSIGRGFNFREPGNAFFLTMDRRFVYPTMTRSEQRNELLAFLDCANTKPAITAAIARWRADEIEDSCGEKRLPLTMVRSPDEWRSHPQGRCLSGRPVIEVEKIADSPPLPFRLAPRPLADIRVLDATHVLAGPIAGRTLAEQGADVLRISAPRQTDQLNFVMDTGIGKRSAFLDLGLASDVERFLQLALDADVFVQSFRPGSLERRGISATEIARKHRGLVYVSISCFGEVGPWKDRTGYDPNAQTVTGITATEGSLENPKRPPTIYLADYLTGYLGAAGALAALIRRSREGGSYHVKLSLCQTCMWLQGLGLVDAENAPQARELARLLTMNSPFGDIEYLAPLTTFKRNKAFWDKPPVPLGASKAEWLPRIRLSQ